MIVAFVTAWIARDKADESAINQRLQRTNARPDTQTQELVPRIGIDWFETAPIELHQRPHVTPGRTRNLDRRQSVILHHASASRNK
jgi:hypothetical protein